VAEFSYVYKIRNPKTGLYSEGSSYPLWTKNGKIWTRRKDILTHLQFVRAIKKRMEVHGNQPFLEYYLEHHEVVCFELREVRVIVL
jgi:hypothetical protein